MNEINKTDLDNSKLYFAMALDPIHIGTGGYRLGRVDNTIVREPGTNIPKIPGTSLKGSTRVYASYKNTIGKKNCILGKEDPCGECDICLAFGYTNCKTNGRPESMHGLIQFSDLRILCFPIYSIAGPVWVTSPRTLKDIGINEKISITNDKIKTNVVKTEQKLNLGWLYLENEDSFSLPDDVLNSIPDDIKQNLVLVSDKLFSQIVNSNLEVRTSIAIDPKTGSVEEGALFTFEAIPRTTIFWFEVIAYIPDHFAMPNTWKKNKEDIFQIFETTFPYFETLGIGGMSTRGFGRIRLFNSKGDGQNE
ncbi:MAG: type III-B CRISPR module RAMP protein Cmr4 [Promethearchaeota archaeon]